MPMSLANGFFDLLHRIHAAPSIATAWDVYFGYARDVGLLFGIAFFFPINKSNGESTIAGTIPDEWMRIYAESRYQDISPVLARAQNSVLPFAWALSDWDGLLDDRQKAWKNNNLIAGIKNGFLIPDRRSGSLEIIALGGDTGTIALSHQRALYYAGLETLARMHELGLSGSDDQYKPLSPRERECLRWIASGKSDSAVGTILSISEKTVATHIDRAKHKMGVATRAQAIVFAMRLGILF